MNDTGWDWRTLNDPTITFADTLNPGQANADYYDLSAFQKRGGKLITYHGLSDPLTPTGASIAYYERVLATMSNGRSTPSLDTAASTSVLDDFYRLFLVPGMSHCAWGGAHPWYFAGAGQPLPAGSSGYSVPGFEDSQHDIVLAVMAWVENGTAPASLMATEWQDRDVAQGVKVQRPVCPYPQQAKYQGGRMEEAGSWVCEEGSGVMVGYPDMVIAKADNASASVATPAVTAIGAGVLNSTAAVSTSFLCALLMVLVLVL
ncbi:hypothetical protein LTR08_003616 [Meristemomyces frigidus]|nr:hypothetical protein LTR08_003616 [Meristemomyces frigidus]